MQICCTKILLDQLDKTMISQANEYEADLLFSWSAHLVTIQRKKAIVVVNDSNRFGFVLYGLKKKDFANLSQLIEDAIARCLAEEGFKQEVIERYVSESGPFIFTKTKDRSAVARLNKACEVAKIFESYVDPETMYQASLSYRVNSDLIKLSKEKDYVHPYEQVIDDMQNWFGASVIERKAVDLLVQLDLGRYKASRRVIVPLPATFYKLHKVLQVAYDWKERHLHDFTIYSTNGNQIARIVSEEAVEDEEWSGSPCYFEHEASLELAMQEGCRVEYCYDFGDSWRHTISIRGYVDGYDKNYPTCIMAEGDGPPEDVGGIAGFEAFLESMGDSTHPDHKSMKRWAEGQWYARLDINKINHRFKYLRALH